MAPSDKNVPRETFLFGAIGSSGSVRVASGDIPTAPTKETKQHSRGGACPRARHRTESLQRCERRAGASPIGCRPAPAYNLIRGESERLLRSRAQVPVVNQKERHSELAEESGRSHPRRPLAQARFLGTLGMTFFFIRVLRRGHSTPGVGPYPCLNPGSLRQPDRPVSAAPNRNL